MIKVNGEKNLPKFLVNDARRYCELVGSDEIHNIATLGEGEYRIMYYIVENEKRVMRAIILKMPTE